MVPDVKAMFMPPNPFCNKQLERQDENQGPLPFDVLWIATKKRASTFFFTLSLLMILMNLNWGEGSCFFPLKYILTQRLW